MRGSVDREGGRKGRREGVEGREGKRERERERERKEDIIVILKPRKRCIYCIEIINVT